MISIFPLWTFHLYVATLGQYLHIYQKMWWSRVYSSYQDLVDRNQLSLRKLLNQRSVVVKLKSSLSKFYDFVKLQNQLSVVDKLKSSLSKFYDLVKPQNQRSVVVKLKSSLLRTLSNVRFSTENNFRRSSVDLHTSTTWSRIMSSFLSTVYSHETESFESLTMKLSIVSSSFCFAWRNTCLSNDICFLGLK